MDGMDHVVHEGGSMGLDAVTRLEVGWGYTAWVRCFGSEKAKRKRGKRSWLLVSDSCFACAGVYGTVLLYVRFLYIVFTFLHFGIDGNRFVFLRIYIFTRAGVQLHGTTSRKTEAMGDRYITRGGCRYLQ